MSDEKNTEYGRDKGEILVPIVMQTTAARPVVTFKTDELTAICPFDFGGPDFYELTIKYKPWDKDKPRGIESKSLKEYVESWRDARISAEDLADEIYNDLIDVVDAEVLYVRLEQNRRGGIEETVEVGNDPHRARS